jgi:uncharacterized protein (TIGR02145 family)
MKKILTIIMFCGIIGGYAQNTPPYAASTQTWVIEGNDISQTWSDHINVPACDKTNFNGGTTEAPRADCRNNPGYYYLYSWSYVNENAATLCPAPWRVPTKDDFIALDKALGGTGDTTEKNVLQASKYSTVWGGVYGGFADRSSVNFAGSLAYYWSAVVNNSTAHSLRFTTEGHITAQKSNYQNFGYLLRCVK